MEALKDLLRDDFEIKGLAELTEIDVFEYLKSTTTKIMKNINTCNDRTLTDNKYFNEYIEQVKSNQKIELTKFKAIIKDLSRRIDRGDF